jgi:hypothetical protein
MQTQQTTSKPSAKNAEPEAGPMVTDEHAPVETQETNGPKGPVLIRYVDGQRKERDVDF